MALTPEQIAREIQDIGTDLPQDLGAAITSAANIAIERIRAAAPVGTGSLASSIRAEFNVESLTLGVAMNDYGFFQNFGVTGTKNATIQFGVPEVISEVLPPRTGDTYSFDPTKRMIGGDLPFGVRVSIHQRGLNAKQFLDIESFVNQVAEYVNENLEI